jgi:hypothetical protein
LHTIRNRNQQGQNQSILPESINMAAAFDHPAGIMINTNSISSAAESLPDARP